MIALGMGLEPPASVVGNSGKAAAWAGQYDASDTHLGEPNVTTAAFGTAPNPTLNRLPRVGTAGLRGVTGWLARTGIPLIPKGPPTIARRGQGMVVAGAQPKPIRNVQQFVPVASATESGDWYQFLS